MLTDDDTALDGDYYTYELSHTEWRVKTRYQQLAALGSGAYGCVASAIDTSVLSSEDDETSNKVAIKKFSRPFQTTLHAKRCYRELKLLATLHHENIIHMIDLFSPDSSLEAFENVYAVTDCMGGDLNQIIRTQPLTDDHVIFLTYQILRALKYIHSAGLVHRDLKPSNIAVSEDCDLKILDFGLARQAESEMTGYVTTRWYRAPEIMLSYKRYNEKVDVWSAGCIMAEMISRTPVFNGANHMDQILKIFSVCGTPEAEYLRRIDDEDTLAYVESIPFQPRMDFNQIFPFTLQNREPIADLLDKMLQLDPNARCSVYEALDHPVFVGLHDDEDEPVEARPFQLDVLNETHSVEEWRLLVWQLVQEYRTSNNGTA